MNGEHDGWMWVNPTEALAEHQSSANCPRGVKRASCSRTRST
jgi:hypothetical protein